jgi:hypothetical protein
MAENLATTKRDTPVVRPRPLSVLVPLIKEDLQTGDEAAKTASMPYYRAAGEKLIEAKSQLPHGQWQAWVKGNFSLSPSHATRYMAFARATAGAQNDRFESFSQFMREEGGDPRYGKVVRREPWHEPIKKIVSTLNTNALQQEALKRNQERELQRRLALKLIDIGYRVLAAELHPDKKGGSREAMSRLNDVRNRLKQAA